MRDLVVLEEALLLKILANPAFVRRFGFLRSTAEQLVKLRQSAATCKPCQRKQQIRSLELGAVKRQIAKMSAGDREEFKRLLDARKVKLFYRNDKDAVVKVVF